MTAQTTTPAPLHQESLRHAYRSVRQHSTALCTPLQTEDYVVQPIADVSPPKWHLAHTTWFFEELLLVAHDANYRRFNAHYPKLFNSYYKAAGEHWLQAERGQLSRPTVEEVMRYRETVDLAMERLLQEHTLPPDALEHLEIGLHHEQQHQELLLMDIKYILGANPSQPTYCNQARADTAAEPSVWHSIPAGNYRAGHADQGFSFDNESPQHTVYLQPFEVRKQLVSNAEYLGFIEAGGYENPVYWLSLGWDWVNTQGITHPLYWHTTGDQWQEFTLAGSKPLNPNLPVSHISYFEANAFANWARARLPTEFELETFLTCEPATTQQSGGDDSMVHPNQLSVNASQLWCWTSSSYAPYPGYKPYTGMLGEYNGKFMCNQYVLRGGCLATPPGHYRHTYRNFYQPSQRWMFSGIALARDTE